MMADLVQTDGPSMRTPCLCLEGFFHVTGSQRMGSALLWCPGSKRCLSMNRKAKWSFDDARNTPARGGTRYVRQCWTRPPAAPEKLQGNVNRTRGFSEPEIGTSFFFRKPCSAVMAVLRMALCGMLPVGCTHPGIRSRVGAECMFPMLKEVLGTNTGNQRLCPAGKSTSFYSQATE